MSKMSFIQEDDNEYEENESYVCIDESNENNDKKCEENESNVYVNESNENNIMDNLITDDNLIPTEFESGDDNNLTDLVVLDPDHVLMKRFQESLHNMLIEQLERIRLQDRETSEDLRKHRVEHVEAGNELFTVQQELSKFQSVLDGLKNDLNTAVYAREDTEVSLNSAKNQYQKIKEHLIYETQKMQEMREEMNNLALRLHYLRSAEDDVRGDIAVMKRAAEKAVEDLHTAEREKMNQDFLLDSLVSEVAKVKEDITLYEAQLVAQEDEKCASKLTLHEAQNEIQSIILEKKQLMNKWNSSLIDLTRRNEAFCSLNDALAEKKEQILVLQNEIEAYRRNARKEQDVNERLTLIFKKSEFDIANLKKNIEDCKSKHDVMKGNYNDNIQILHQTETMLLFVMKEKKEQRLVFDEFLNQIESLYKLKNDLEDKISEELRNKMTMKSVEQHIEKQRKRTRDQSRQLESQLVFLDNAESKNFLKLAELKAEISEINNGLKVMESEISEKNDTINKLEIEMARSKTSIERRQDSIDVLNKQLEALLASRGGIEFGPLEITISHLNKNIQTAYEEVSNLEQEWLHKQHEIVNLLEVKSKLNETISRLKQQSFLLVQKKLRIEGYIDNENIEIGHIKKDLFQIQNKMVKINKSIYKERFSQENLEKLNHFQEQDFVSELKEEERETIKLKSKIDEIENKKNLCLKDIVETQWQVMMYEKKIQLIQEAQLTISSTLGQGELKSMKAEIHRMEVRYKQLCLQQELLIQDMEKSVVKRDMITKRGEALEKMQNKVTTKGALKRVTMQINRKTNGIMKNAEECEERTAAAKAKYKELLEQIQSNKERNEEKRKELHNITIHLEEISNIKYSQLMELQQKQQFFKYYSEVREKKYVRGWKTVSSLEKERSIQTEKTQSLLLILDRIITEFPQTQSTLNLTRQLIQKIVDEGCN